MGNRSHFFTSLKNAPSLPSHGEQFKMKPATLSYSVFSSLRVPIYIPTFFCPLSVSVTVCLGQTHSGKIARVESSGTQRSLRRVKVCSPSSLRGCPSNFSAETNTEK